LSITNPKRENKGGKSFYSILKIPEMPNTVNILNEVARHTDRRNTSGVNQRKPFRKNLNSIDRAPD